MRRIPYEKALNAYSYKIDMGGAGGEACKTKSLGTQIKATLAKAVRIAQSGGECSDCTNDEQVLIDAFLRIPKGTN
ncbi:hypothetical protein HBA54_13110 [Pelagibius litoralis]|uniref:Uncharacterized protein n=1 Tax=Pelagibius litoralis TaxID=374515 RepID=A0A967EY58_9PROT|nr:hypothetical protein [Pelagibius litoralis]NIA69534.1 hypothetical protein [Pelagibius litoralis]